MSQGYESKTQPTLEDGEHVHEKESRERNQKRRMKQKEKRVDKGLAQERLAIAPSSLLLSQCSTNHMY